MRLNFARRKSGFTHQTLKNVEEEDDAGGPFDTSPSLIHSDESCSNEEMGDFYHVPSVHPISQLGYWGGHRYQEDDEDVRAVEKVLQETGFFNVETVVQGGHSDEEPLAVTTSHLSLKVINSSEPVWKRRFRSATASVTPESAADLCAFEVEGAKQTPVKPAMKKKSSFNKETPIPVTKSVSFDETSLHRSVQGSLRRSPRLERTERTAEDGVESTTTPGGSTITPSTTTFGQSTTTNGTSTATSLTTSHGGKGTYTDIFREITDEDIFSLQTPSYYSEDFTCTEDEDNTTISSYRPRLRSQRASKDCPTSDLSNSLGCRSHSGEPAASLKDDFLFFAKLMITEATCYDCGASQASQSTFSRPISRPKPKGRSKSS